ncbi:hydrolase [Prosthecochloris sp. N3]|uniref:Hydrolase n=1 Tax=Prosthecochloris ethylica TaxID=2743976 RepID=A0ABR9XQG2_9CHLB|nr:MULTISPECIES: hydrolase [Prosthecochloris]MEC9485906.1 hydrolase [Prosthecochloris sp.]MBF0586529.1 hydrolase [Prosthecochloris ethylica]MBF0636142.1 hydrolase [Prosthecochloris ethylica]NUK47721.1 hydrolase [Prosthecochloris ethylica]RNA64384.1 hydrolase [Prosthecochloris sp. ZM_2]
MLTRDETVLLIIDVQGKLARLVHDSEALVKNISKLVRACRILGVPVLYTEQYPKGLGVTVDSIRELLVEEAPFEKVSFSCCGAEGFMQHLRTINRNEIIVTGIESHVCVYQTSVELIEYGYNVHLITDAVSSRSRDNRDIGIHCIETAGAWVKSTEMVIFELLKIAEGEQFKAISSIIKE